MSLFPDQRSTEDQMRDLYRLAVEHGMYDAADVVKRWLQPRTALHHINGNPYDNRPENLEVVDLATRARTAPPLVDLPEDFLDHGPRPKGQVGWRCRYCSKGRMFLGTVREEAAEARAHEAQCPARTAKPDTEETPAMAADREQLDPATAASLARGLAQSAAGQTVDLGDFTQYATDTEEPQP